MANKKEYMRRYMLERYRRRRNEAIEQLGGKCTECDKTDNLELDHVDPSTKSFTIAKSGSVSEERWKNELHKCQLLCRLCHVSKTLKDRGQKSAREKHGTISSYRYCKCDLCREAKAKYTREYRKKKGR